MFLQSEYFSTNNISYYGTFWIHRDSLALYWQLMARLVKKLIFVKKTMVVVAMIATPVMVRCVFQY